jgi:Cu2+-exporting ATPase
VDPCFHCGEPIPAGATWVATVAGSARAVCCPGCRAAAEWIAGLGLENYYRLREAPAHRPQDDGDFSAWDRPALARLHVRRHSEDHAEIVLLVEHLRCSACAWLIEHALGSTNGVREVGVNAAARRVRLAFDPQRAQLSGLMQLLSRLGYTPRPLDAASLDSLRQREDRTAMKRLVVAGLGAMQAMMYAVALYAGGFDGIDPATRDFFRWLGFLVATPVVLYSARPFFAGALREWRARHLSMDTPIALAIALIYTASLVETVLRGHEIYFDSVTMFVFFLLAARYVEMRARHRAGDLVDALARLQPPTAERLTSSGSEQVGSHELATGDRLRIGAGATVPADSVLLSAACRVDESLLTGESTPLLRRAGDMLIAGSLLIDGPVEARVEHVGADTILAGIVRMVTRAAGNKGQLARAADRHASRFVLRVFAVTAITTLAWLVIDPSRAFPAALAVLVVSCPCAFALAVPAALTRAVAVLAQRGVLVVDGDAPETLAKADVFVFDKTGTLTEPRLAHGDITAHRGLSRPSMASEALGLLPGGLSRPSMASEALGLLPGGSVDDALAIAAALEQGSSHPFAQALCNAAVGLALPPAGNLRNVAGAGVSGEVDGIEYRLGHASFATGEEASGDSLVLADAKGIIAEFHLRERLRAGVAGALAQLRADGARIEIVSGDAPGRVAEVAAELEADHWQARATPAQKLEHIEQLRGAGRVVAMIGDGVNDAPVLAAANVSVALASGAALAQATSGVVLAANRIDELPRARAVARRMQRVLRQNLAWAVAYNLSVVPLAAFGWVPPWLAAIGMSASSLLVVLNSLRIRAPHGAATQEAPKAPAVTEAIA